MDIITEFSGKFINQINELKKKNEQLVNEYNKLKDSYDSLNERHNEIKAAYVESENENMLLTEKLNINNSDLNKQVYDYLNNAFNSINLTDEQNKNVKPSLDVDVKEENKPRKSPKKVVRVKSRTISSDSSDCEEPNFIKQYNENLKVKGPGPIKRSSSSVVESLPTAFTFGMPITPADKPINQDVFSNERILHSFFNITGKK
jgi:tRNA G10  N-methylase Trm11